MTTALPRGPGDFGARKWVAADPPQFLHDGFLDGGAIAVIGIVGNAILLKL